MVSEKIKDACFYIKRALAYLSQSYFYENWDNDFSRKESKEIMKNFETAMKKLDVDFNNLTAEECCALGCSEKYLIPLYLFDVIPDGTKVIDIFEKEYEWDKSKMNNDHRGGYLAYMLIPVDK